MVLLVLELRADLDSLTDLRPSNGSEFTYYFKIKCGSCGEVSQKYSCVTASEQVEMPKSRGKAHLVQKCKFCGREGSINMIEGRGRPFTLEDSQSGKYVPVMCFDCRGIEPVEFSSRDEWAAEGITGTKFTGIDLSDGEFAEYDEKASCPVGVTNLEHKFVITT